MIKYFVDVYVVSREREGILIMQFDREFSRTFSYQKVRSIINDSLRTDYHLLGDIFFVIEQEVF